MTTGIGTTTIKLDPETKARVKRLAEARKRTSHWVMLEAIREYVGREEKREEFQQCALTAWENYQQTGRHVTEAEADQWLENLESGKDVEPPECHG
jgi:predicted transcriptional regulator